MIGTIRGGSAMCALFSEALPRLLEESRLKHADFSLFLALEGLKIMENDGNIPGEDNTVSFNTGDFTFVASSVCVDHTETGPLMSVYPHAEDISDPALIDRCSLLLNTSPENLKIQRVGKTVILFSADLPEIQVTPTEAFCLLAEVLISLFGSRQVSEIETIRFPIASAGTFHFHLTVEDDGANLKMYNLFGCESGKMENISLRDTLNTCDESTCVNGEDTSPFSNKSLILSCLKEMGFDVTQLTDEESFFSFGLDSLEMAELEQHLSAKTSLQLPIGCVEQNPSVSSLNAFLSSLQKTNPRNEPVLPYFVPSKWQRRILMTDAIEPQLNVQFNEVAGFQIQTLTLENRKRTIRHLNKIVQKMIIWNRSLRSIYTYEQKKLLSGTECFILPGNELTGSFVARPIDVSVGPPLLWNIYNDVICILFHHVAVDGHSIRLIVKQLLHLYQGRELRPVIPYREEIRADSEDEEDEEGEVEPIPTDFPPPPKPQRRAQVYRRKLPKIFPQLMGDVRTRMKATDFEIFCSAFSLANQKRTGNASVEIGMAVSVRKKNQEQLVDCLVTVVPVRLTVNGTDTVEGHIKTSATILKHGREKAEKTRYRPVQVLLVMDKVEEVSLPGFEQVDVPTAICKHDQVWYLRKTGSKWEIVVEICEELFHEYTIDASIDAVLRIIRRMSLSRKTTPISQISLGSFQDFKKWDFPKSTIGEIFAKRRNDNVFWKCGNDSISRAKIERKTLETARSWQQRYICHYGEVLSGDRQLVLFTPRGISLGIYVLSSWKLGLAVVPISRDWPKKRILATVKRFHNAMVVTDNEELLQLLKEGHVCVNDGREKRRQGRQLWNVMSPVSLGYMTCTSGSTGEPKVVCSSIQGLSNLGANYVRKLSISTKTIVYQVINYAFDIFFADLTKVIVSGASIIFAEEPIPSLKEIAQCSCAYVMPAVLSSLPADHLQKLECLETLHFGGESIRPAALDRLLKIGTSLFQEFGLTEHSVYSSCSRQKAFSNVKQLGTPYPNQGFVLRDRDGNPLGGSGSRGELFVKGLVARGYHGMEELNREKFKGGEMATRDMVVLQQGRLYFAGRMDLQMKILGRRVELGEVEAAVAKHPEVEMAVASVHHDKLYVHVTVKTKVNADELMALCQKQLPLHMLPEEIVFIERIPLNANGKVDRKQLIVHQSSQSVERREPQTQMECFVCEMMAKILGNPISVEECFFRAGGNSLKAMLLVQEVKERGGNVLLKDIFELRTPERIARRVTIDGQKQDRAEILLQKEEVCNSNEIVLQLVEKTTFLPSSGEAEGFPKLYPLSHVQRRLWFLQKLNPNSDAYKCTLKIGYPPEVDVHMLKRAIEKLQQVNMFAKSRVVEHEGSPFWEIQSSEPSDLLTTEWKQGECLLHMNHLICDGRSLAILADQLARIYNGMDVSIQPSMPYSEDQTDLGFWSEYLDDVTAPIFPERPKPRPNGTNETGRIKRTFPRQIEKFIKANPEKTFSFLVAAVVEVMRKVFDEEDIVIGTTVANRTKENYDTVGLFANTLPMRFTNRTQKELNEAAEQIHLILEHQNSSLEDIQRNIGTSELLVSVVNYQNVSIETLPLTKETLLEAELLESKHAQFPLSWIFSNQKEGLSLTLEFNTDLVAEADARKWESVFFREMRRILAAEKVHPPRSILKVLDFPNKHFAEILTKQSERSSSKFMMKTAQKGITYEDGIADSLSLAKVMEQEMLKTLGRSPRPDDIILIKLKEGLQLHLLINAVLLLGCAYTIVSPTFPQERQLLILEETQPSLVITSFPHLKHRMRPFFSRASPDHLVYLMFTSGSTGRPKGVPIASAGVCNMLSHATKLYHLRPTAKVLQFTKSHFDASVSNTFGPFVNGGTLCLRSEEDEAADGVREHLPLTLLHMTPAVLEYLSNDDGLISDVESWSIGGESPSRSTVSSLLNKGSRLVQLYGPTEATCYQTASVLKCFDEVNNVGPGIPNVLVGVCDWKNGDIGSEDVGQFFCGGIQLARGYLNDKDKTKRTFVTNPVVTEDDSILERNTKIYLTGDRVRIDEHRNLHFLGRRDQQGKVNGHRIELGEVESAIATIEGVQSTAVVIQKDQTGKSHLVAFVTGGGLLEESLLLSIRRKLPPHMIPMRVIPLCEMPTTANTKIDKKGLAQRTDLISKEIRKSEKEEGPKGLLIYKELLGDMEENDNFFFKGGHSLMANKLAYKLQTAFEVDVPVAKVFEHPTPRQMMKWIREEQNQITSLSHPDALPYSNRPSPLQLPLLRLYRNPLMQQVYNNHTEIHFHNDISRKTVIRLINTLLLAHSSLRTTFRRFGKSVTKTTLSGTKCHIKPIDETEIDVFKEIPVKISIDGRKVILHTNHAAVDGHSMAILVQNLEILLKGGTVKRDNSEGLNLWLETMFSKSCENSLQFWTKQLKEFTLNPLLGDTLKKEYRFKSGNSQLRVANLPFMLSSLAKQYSSSPFAVLMAATAFSMSKSSFRPSAPISIGFPVNLRPDQFHYSVTMGVNTSLALLSPSGIAEDITATAAVIASALAHPLPFDELVSLAPGDKVFDVMLTFDDYTLVSNEFFRLEKTKEVFTKSPIAIFAGPNTEELSVDYMVDRFTEGWIRQFLETIESTIRQWCQNNQETKEHTYHFDKSHPLSPAQTQMFILSKSGDSRILPFLLELPDDMIRRRITQLVNLLLQKHECLRTAFFLETNGEPRQTLLSLTEAFHLPVYKRYEKHRPPSSIVIHENVLELQIDGKLAVLWLHHIVSDAWSTKILEKELVNLMENNVTEVTRNKSSLIDLIRKKKLASKKPAAEPLNHIAIDNSLLPLQSTDFSVFREYFDMSLEKNVFSCVVHSVVQSVLEKFPFNSLNIGFPSANRNTKNSHIVGYFLNNLVINVNKMDSLEEVEEKKTDAMAENATFSQLVAEIRKINGKDDHPPFQIFVNCRYDLESVEEGEDKLMEMLPLNAEFPLEVDVDKRGKQFRVTVRGKGEFFGKSQFNEIFQDFKRRLKRENKTLDTVVSVARMILKREISAADSFFAKGGTSLQAISLGEELEEKLEIEVEMETIYASKTIAELAERLEEKGENKDTPQTSEESEIRSTETNEASEVDKKEETSSRIVLGRSTDTPKIPLSRILHSSALSSRTLFLLPDHSKVSYDSFHSSVSSKSQNLLSSFLRLTGRPLRPDDVIPVVGQKSIDTWVLCLSVVHSGASYIPLDSSNPIERLNSAFKLSSAVCYLGDEVCGINVPRLILDGERKVSVAPLLRNQCTDVSYVISTSGTTGKPKAVCAVHRGVVNMVMAAVQDMRLTPRDVLFQFTNFCFDNSVLELFSSLAASSSVLIDPSLFSPRRFSRLVASHNITHCLLFPALVSLFKDDTFRCLSALRYWVVGAEKLPKKLLERAWREGVNVIQNYGPTETTAYALTRHMRMGDEATNIGKPIQNCRTQIFDGELALSGSCLMRGYLGRKDAFRLRNGIHWYLTGDKVKVTEENNTLFVGRKDNQVKIRGHRVELGEVEERVLTKEGVEQCRARWKEPTLTVYCVAPFLQEKHIMEHCERTLPVYMRPNEVVLLQELPITPNAKVDFSLLEVPKNLLEIVAKVIKSQVNSGKSLLEHGGTTKQGLAVIEMTQKTLGWSPTIEQLMTEPVGEIKNRKEKKSRVREAWMAVLGHEDFNKDSHFLLSGGTSLHLLRLRQELNRRGIEVSVKTLMEMPKLGQMERLETPKLCSIVVYPSSVLRTLVFLHPLYGGCAPYIHIQNLLNDGKTKIVFVEHPNTLNFATEELGFSESIDSLTTSYADQLQDILEGDVILLGASIGGTLAVEVSRKLRETPKAVILIDTLAEPNLETYLFDQHKQQLLSECAFVDAAVLSNSWDLLQMLKRHSRCPVVFPLELFSVDGSDLGWNRLSPRVSVHRVSGPHSSLFSPFSSASLAASIRLLL